MEEYDTTYADPAQFAEDMGGEVPFGGGIGGSVGGEVHIDGTPFRLATIVVVGLLILVVFNQGGFRFHVTV